MATQTTTVQQEETLEQRFQRLLGEWHKAVGHLSSATRRYGHPTFQEIIAIGPPAIPLLLGEIARTKNGHLGAALSAITKVNPIAEEDYGKIDRIAETWLRWGKENGFQW